MSRKDFLKRAKEEILEAQKAAIYSYRKAVEVCLLQTAVQIQQETKTQASYNRVKIKWGKAKKYEKILSKIGLPRFPKWDIL